MAVYHYAAYFNTPLHQSPAALASHHPFGISSTTLNLPTSPANLAKPNSAMSTHEHLVGRATHEQHTSIFLRLPAELRMQIYETLLCPGILNKQELSIRIQRPRKDQTLHPAILSSCRKIHHEAINLLYAPHIFQAHPSLLASLPNLASPASPVLYPNMLAKIKRWQLTLRLDTDPRFTKEQATEAFSGAEYFEIRVWQSMYDGCDSSVLRLFLGVRGVKIARVNGCADAELAAWLEDRMMSTDVREDKGACECVGHTRKMTCDECSKPVDGTVEWFSERNAWQFGNR